MDTIRTRKQAMEESGRTQSTQNMIKMVEEAHEAIECFKQFKELKANLESSFTKDRQNYMRIQTVEFLYGSKLTETTLNKKGIAVMKVMIDEIIERYETKFRELGIDINNY